MKQFLLISGFLILSFAELSAQGNIVRPSVPGRQVITEHMLKSYGITTLSDVLTLAESWNYVTINGNSGFFSANNLSLFDRQNVLILLDGQVFDVGIFDVQDLNILPVSIDQVDYVELINVPGIYGGRFASGGAIHLHTKKPAHGLSLQGTHILGDETGDPGPLAYTEFTTPNVDKLTQNFSVNVNSAGENWFMSGSIKHEEAFETDPAVNRRLSRLNIDDNKTALISYMYKLNLSMLGGNQEFFTGITSNRNFFFFKPYGNEIPVEQTFRHIGFAGNAAIGNIGFNYSVKHSFNELGYINNTEQLNFNFGIRNLSINAEAWYRTGFLKILTGAGYENYAAVTPEALDSDLSFRNLYGIIDFYPSSNFSQSFGVYVTKHYSDNSIKGYVSSRLNINRYNQVYSNFSFFQNLFAEDKNFPVWNSLGYNFNPGTSDFNTPENFNTKETFTADINYHFMPDTSLTFEVGADYRRFSNFYLEKHFYQYNAQNSTYSSVTDIMNDEYMKSLGVSAGIKFKLKYNIELGSFYKYNMILDGSEVFKNEWEVLPQHSAVLNIIYQPFQNLGLSARVKYYSSTTWYDYKFVTYQSSGENIVYNNKVDDKLLVDFSANTWLFNRKLWLNALFRNILNQTEKYHPIGADLDFRVYFQIHLYLNSLAE